MKPPRENERTLRETELHWSTCLLFAQKHMFSRPWSQHRDWNAVVVVFPPRCFRRKLSSPGGGYSIPRTKLLSPPTLLPRPPTGHRAYVDFSWYPTQNTTITFFPSVSVDSEVFPPSGSLWCHRCLGIQVQVRWVYSFSSEFLTQKKTVCESLLLMRQLPGAPGWHIPSPYFPYFLCLPWTMTSAGRPQRQELTPPSNSPSVAHLGISPFFFLPILSVLSERGVPEGDIMEKAVSARRRRSSIQDVYARRFLPPPALLEPASSWSPLPPPIPCPCPSRCHTSLLPRPLSQLEEISKMPASLGS